jgi:hypothetical protein
LLIEGILCLGRLARLASKKDARHLFRGGDSNRLYNILRKMLYNLFRVLALLPCCLCRHFKRTQINAQSEAYTEKRGNPKLIEALLDRSLQLFYSLFTIALPTIRLVSVVVSPPAPLD